MSEFAPTDWAVVVVNMDGGEMLFESLASIDAQGAPPRERILVDNGSRPAELEEVARRHPLWRIEALGANYGFAHGSNVGIARTGSPWVALVNNDVVLDGEWAERLLARTTGDGESQPVRRSLWAATPEPAGPLAALQGAVLDREGKKVDTLGITLDETYAAVPLAAGRDAPAVLVGSPLEIRGPSATAALYRRESLRAASGGRPEVFPPEFFAWYEDVDLGFRFWRLGFRVVCDPRAVALHRGSVTGDRTPSRRRRLLARNRRWALARNLEPEGLARIAEFLRHGDRRSVTSALASGGIAGLRGALAGVREGAKEPPPPDPIDARKLSLRDLDDEAARGRYWRRSA